MASGGAASFLSVLKRFGAANPAPLSFPTPGWTLAIDVPAGAHGVGELFHEIDRLVLDAGGRHYLTKDAHTTPATIRRGYPRLEEWQAVRDKADPGRVWASDLARRLELLG
jgi:decaprenylphospho-beta-D-ribofuranose 2-oxidase